jgi:hypothetical protein
VDDDIVPGQSHDAIADKLEVGVRSCISFSIPPSSMKRVPIELNDEPMRGPERIDLVRMVFALE